MVRIPGKVLGVVAALALGVHAYRVVPWFHELLYGHTELGTLVFLPTVLTLALGRIVHDLLFPLIPHWTGQALLAGVLLLARFLTLPGAMVPRHAVRAEAWSTPDSLLTAGVVGWSGYLLCTTVALEGHLWLALAVLVFCAAGVARRARAGRWFALLALAVIGFPTDLVEAYPSWFSYASHEFVPLAGLGLGATALVPWLRRHDRRAGALAGLSFGALFLHHQDPLALAGGVVLLAASRPRQRAFAGAWFGASAFASLLLGFGTLGGRELLERGRTGLVAWTTLTSGFGLLLPGAALALALGLLTFPWRASPQPGTLDEPRREGLALTALVVLVTLLVWPAASPWPMAAAHAFLAPVLVLASTLVLTPAARDD